MSVLNKDVLSGAFFVLVGGAGLWLGNDYAMGTAFRMGPGYFPRVLCGMLVAIGFIVAAKGVIAGGEQPEGLHWKPMILITVAVLAFAGLITTLGLLPAAAAVAIPPRPCATKPYWKHCTPPACASPNWSISMCQM